MAFEDYADTILSAAESTGVPADLLTNLLHTESRFNPRAVSPAGAIGIAQFMPATAREMGIDPTDPIQSIGAAARYLRQNIDRFDGDIAAGVAAYNAGPGRVAKAMQVGGENWMQLLPMETRNYIPQVMRDADYSVGEPVAKEADGGEFNAFDHAMSLDMSKIGAPAVDARNKTVFDTLKSGTAGMLRAFGATVDLNQRDRDELSQAGAAATADAGKRDADLEALMQDIQTTKAALGEDTGWLETGKALAGAAWRNPRGAGLLLAEQLPNSAAALAAGGAGALAGSALGPVGTIAGGIVGLFGANYGLETGNKAIEAAQRGELSDADMSRVNQEGLVKGGVITAVDAATMGLGGKLFGMSQRAVTKAGESVLRNAGIDVADKAAVAAAIKANPALIEAVQTAERGAYQAATTLGQRAMRGGAGVSLETLGEGVGEYWGEGLATGNWDKMEAMIEAFSSLGQSAAQSSISAMRNKVDPAISVLAAQDVEGAIAAAKSELDGAATKALDSASLDPAIVAYDDLIGQQRQVRDASQQALLGEEEYAPGVAQPAESFTNRFPPEPPRALTYHPTAGAMVVFPDGSTMTRAEYEQRKAQEEQARLDGMVQDAPLPRMMERARERAAPVEDAQEFNALVQSERADKDARLKAEIERLRAGKQTAAPSTATPEGDLSKSRAEMAAKANEAMPTAQRSKGHVAFVPATENSPVVQEIVARQDGRLGITDVGKAIDGATGNRFSRSLMHDTPENRKKLIAELGGVTVKQQKSTPTTTEQPKEAVPFSIGQTPGNAEPITVKNGVVHVGAYPVQDFETGNDVTVPEGANNQQVVAALKAAGAIANGQRVFGAGETEASAPTPIAAQEPAATSGEFKGEKWSITPYRYAKNSVVMQVSRGDGYKGQLARVVEALGGRYVNRAKGYVLSEAKARKALAMVEQGYDGNAFTGKLEEPKKADGRDAASEGQKVFSFVQQVQSGAPHPHSIVVNLATPVKREKVLAETGVDIRNARELLIEDTVVHVDNRHPNMTLDDWAMLPDIAESFDRSYLGEQQGDPKTQRVVFVRNDAPHNYVYVAEFASGKKYGDRLILRTFFKDTPRSVEDFIAKHTKEMGASVGARESSRPASSAPNLAAPDTNIPNAQPVSKIEDFGEKIGGARKDVWTSFKDKLGEVSDDDIITQPLSKIWPEPDYQKMLDDGADSWAVAFIHAARDEIPRKPGLPYKQRRWAEQLKTLRGMASDIISGVTSVETVRSELAKVSGLKKIANRVELYQLVGHSKSLAGVSFAEHFYSLYRGKENVRLWAVEQDARATAFSNWPREIVTADTKAELLQKFKDKFASLDLGAAKKKDVQFDIYSRKDNGFWIAKKVGRNPLWLAGPFATVGEARAYRDANSAELAATLEKRKEIPSERRDTNNPRVGEDMRNGQDVTPQMFGEAFGFKGVEFGNWVEQKKRQKDLNDAYDALMDMAAILGVPPKSLSLNGELGLAFGARGSGGIGAAAAHYEPGKVVINLTKKDGAGSLGHEWWHALDNYFQRMRSKGEYATEALDVSLAARGSEFVANTAVRKEMIEAFGEVVKAIRMTALKARSSKLDAKRSKEYWTTGREMSARAFESYLISKLQDQNASNDYLANIVDDETWAAAESLGFELEGSYPYPTAGEMPLIRGAFEKFFQTIEHEQTDKGVRLYSESRSTLPVAKEAVRELSVPESAEVAKLLGDELPDAGKAGVISDISTLPSAAEATGQRMSRKTAEAIRFIAQMFGRKVVFYEATHNVPEGMNLDGKMLYVNVDSGVDALAVAGHEFIHSLEHTDPKAYRAALDAVKAMLAAEGRADAYAEYYGKQGMKGDALARELLSDIGGNLWRDEQFFGDMFAEIQRQHPHQEARSIISRLRDALVSFINKLIAATPKRGFELEERGIVTREELANVRDMIVKMAANAFVAEEKARVSGESMYQPGRAAEVRMSASRAMLNNDEVPNEQSSNRAIDRADLSSLRRAAARLERPQDGLFLRVTEDGRAIATGQKGQRIPESFRRFAKDNDLTLTAERRLPTPYRGIAATGGDVTPRSEPMPIEYRENGAMYFGEMGGEALDRTEMTRFSAQRLAPNGRPSNLDEKLYAAVRTPQFKAWFGDWEKYATMQGGVWNDGEGEVSKVVDENGEPKVVYHGTQRGGFTRMAPEKGDKHRSPMIFAAADRNVARTYSGNGDEVSFDLDQQWLNALADEYHSKPFAELSKEDQLEIENELRNEQDQSGIYSLFLNIRNPYESDFEGANWDGQRFDSYEVVDEDGETQYDDQGRGVFSEDDAIALAERLGEGFEARQASDHYETTNSVAEEAKRYGHDGAIIRQVVDDGGQYGAADATDVFVFFDSNQAKSATQNNGEYSRANDDLRYSTQRRNMEWQPEQGEAGPVFKGDGFTVHAVRQFKTDTDFEEEDGLPWGHATYVEDKAYRFNILDPQGNSIGGVDAEVNELDEITAIHDIKIVDSGKGVGTKIVAQMLANSYDGIRIIEALQQSKEFWEKFGASYDYRDNAKISWEDYERLSGQGSAAQADDRRMSPARGEAEAGEDAKASREEVTDNATRRGGVSLSTPRAQRGEESKPFTLEVSPHDGQRFRDGVTAVDEDDAMRFAQFLWPDADIRIIAQKQFVPGLRYSAQRAKVGEFETGRPVTFNFLHNTDSATNLFGLPENGDQFQRDYEPSGRYVIAADSFANMPKNYVSGRLSFNNPLVIDHDNWKKSLSQEYGGKTGKRLSEALIADGYDGVVTVDKKYNTTSEILDLTTFDSAKARYSTQRNQTETPEFKKWFGDSKVVDADGKPLVVYHGTRSDFAEFDTEKSRTNGGFFFSSDPTFSSSPAYTGYIGGRETGGGNVMPVFLSISKPKEIESIGMNPMWESGAIDVARHEGYDGIHVKNGDYWIAFRPEQIKSAIGNTGAFDGSNPDIRKSNSRSPAFQLQETDRLDNVIYKLQDKQIDLKRVVQAIRETGKTIDDIWNPYLQEELYHGRSAKAVKDFNDFELRPLLQDMQMRGISMADFETYLHNRHAEEANRHIAKINPGDTEMQDGGSGIKTMDARAYLSGLSQAKRNAYEALAKRVDSINKKTRQMLVDSGMEKQSTIDAWESAYQYYVPLFREDAESAPGTGTGFSVRGEAAKKRTGSKKKVVDILANIAMQRERQVTRIEKNRVATALGGLAKAVPNADFWTVDEAPKERVTQNIAIYSVMDQNGNKVAEFTSMGEADKFARKDPSLTVEQKWADRVVERADPMHRMRENVVSFRVDGEDHFVTINDATERGQRMAQSIKNLDADQLGQALSVAGKITRYFASINTQYNPIFGIINLIRDSQGAMMNLSTTPLKGMQAQVMGDTISALRGIYSDLRAHRAGQVPNSKWAQLWEEFQKTGGQTGYKDMFATSKDRAEAIEKELNAINRGAPLKAAGAVFDWLSDYNETMENAVRLASYKAGLSRGMSKEQAASVAKNLTVNFNRKGQAAAQMGALYAFFNANVQGTARLVETLKGPMGKRIIYGGLLLGSMQAMLLAAAGFDDDEPPQFVRERNLIIPIGGGKYITIPMPLGFHVLPNLGRIPTEFVMGGFRNPVEFGSRMVGLVFDTFNPMGSAGLSLQTIAPTVIDPFAALAENKDWTGKPIAKTNFNPLSPTPGYLRAKDTASFMAKKIAYATNLLTGGTDYKPGLISPTPDQIDYLFGQATGGVGREYSKIEQTISGTSSGEEVPLYKVPLVGRFVGDTTGQSSQGNKFYAAVKRINEHENEIKGLRAEGRNADVVAYIRDNPEAMLVQAGNAVEREVSYLRRQKAKLVKQGAPKAEIARIEDRITLKMRMFNERVRKLETSRSN